MKKKKLPTLSALEKKLDKIFSEYIRRKDADYGGTVECCTWWKTEPNVGRVANGVAARVDRLKAIGNGQVPGVAAKAWRILNELATS